MGHLEFQLTGVRSSRRSQRNRSQRQSALVVGGLLAGMILAGTHSPEPSMPAISIADMPEFGNQMVGVLSPLHSVSIQNSGTDTLEIVSITILAVEDSPSTDFVIAPGNCEKSRIEKGASCQIGIGFSPKGVGLRQAKLVLQGQCRRKPPLVLSGGDRSFAASRGCACQSARCGFWNIGRRWKE